MSAIKSLARKSTLTDAQVESLTTYRRVAAGELTLREAARMRSGGEVSVGSYYRTVQQARTNIRSSLMTLMVGLWLDCVKADDVRKLVELGTKRLAELDDESAGKLGAVLGALVERIVM